MNVVTQAITDGGPVRKIAITWPSRTEPMAATISTASRVGRAEPGQACGAEREHCRRERRQRRE